MSTKTKIIGEAVLLFFAMGTTGQAAKSNSGGGVYLGWLFITLVLFVALIVEIAKAVKNKKQTPKS